MKILYRRYVTLLELLIVMAIILIIGGLVSIGIKKALDEQRFRTEVSLIVDQLRLAQDLMLILGTDVRVVFTSKSGDKNSEGIESSLELETKISPSIEREVLRKRSNLKAIKGVQFHDKESKPGEITLRFQSKGAVMSTGLMMLSTTSVTPPPDNALVTYICLPGYPRHIYNEDDYEKANTECKIAQESVNDHALTQDTFSKIPELSKSDKDADKEDKKTKGADQGTKQPLESSKKTPGKNSSGIND